MIDRYKGRESFFTSFTTYSTRCKVWPRWTLMDDTSIDESKVDVLSYDLLQRCKVHGILRPHWASTFHLTMYGISSRTESVEIFVPEIVSQQTSGWTILYLKVLMSCFKIKTFTFVNTVKEKSQRQTVYSLFCYRK